MNEEMEERNEEGKFDWNPTTACFYYRERAFTWLGYLHDFLK